MMADSERLVRFDGGAFASQIRGAMRQRGVSINRLSEETFVPYQTCWRLVTAANVRNIEAIYSVAGYLGVDVAPHIQTPA